MMDDAIMEVDSTRSGCKIVFLTPSLSRLGAGIFEVQINLATSLRALGYLDINALGLSDEFSNEDRNLWGECNIHALESIGPKRLAYSPNLRSKMTLLNPDITHLHVLWLYTSIISKSWSTTAQGPVVITPNGMLDPWALKNSAFKKKLAWLLYEEKNLQSAKCIQANTVKEFQDIRRLGIKTPVCVIPNGVALPPKEFDHSQDLGRNESFHPRRVLSLSRIHPKKGLAYLLTGYQYWKSKSANPDGKLQIIIAGRDEGGHLAELIRLAGELKLVYRRVGSVDECIECTEEIVFCGPAYGKDKEKLFETSDIFALPSHSEGQPMAPLDALAHSLPLMITKECNLSEAFVEEAALEVGATKESIASSIDRFLELSDMDLKEMGKNGRRLVERSFTWDVVARDLSAVYSWLLGGGNTPSSIES